jgi:hypothetical protein
MTTITLTSLTATQSATPKKSKLNQLWHDIDKKRQRNQRYQAKLDKFYQEFKTSTEASEHAVCVATESWIGHLISFIPRKTIKGAEREALYDWLQEELSILESNPFNPVNTNDLREAFNQALFTDVSNQPVPDDIPAEVIEAFRQELEMMIGDDVGLSHEELMEMVSEPHKFQRYLQELLAEKMDAEGGGEDEDIDWGAEDFFSDEESYHQFDAPSSSVGKALYNDKQMTKLYRQLAKQLHPDKETDEAKKAEKSALMQQLSQAKKEKDVVALLLMAQQYLPDHEMVMDDQLLAHLEATLKEKVAQLNQEYQELKHGDDLKSIIWHKFGGGNKASRERHLSQYRETLQQEAKALRQRCQEVKTVKQIKQHLKERADAALFHEQLMSIDPHNFFSADGDWL